MNNKPLKMYTWIRAPWVLSFDLFFTLYGLSASMKDIGKKAYHCRKTCQFFEKNRFKNILYFLLVEDNYCQMKNRMKKTKRHSIRGRLQDLIEEISGRCSSLTIRSVSLDLIHTFIPYFPFLLDTNSTKIHK